MQGGAGRAARPARRRAVELAILGLAIAAAIAIAVFLLTGGGRPTPAEVVRDFYFAIERGDERTFERLLDPPLREDDDRYFIALSTSLVELGPGVGPAVEFRDLTVQELSREDGWALVGVRGSARLDGQLTPVRETVYVRELDDGWVVSNPRQYAQFREPGPSLTPLAPGLGPLEPSRPRVGSPAPDFALIDARDNQTVRRLSDYRGKAVILNWYASWCGPCEREMPDFQDAYEAFPDRLVVLAVNYFESAATARKFLDETVGVTFPSVLDSTGSVADHYRVGRGLPTTFFIDTDGVLVDFQIGEVRTDDLKRHLAALGFDWTPTP